ncbi:hypothetical protein Taro_036086 [Colocasia esculenta]|uniref:Uncharacterized protein n=1 Tax=Colocasia esculenta TaxID=4460 RepID=A0A843W5Q7_COLES|nr:hypothetical protein [Colocasia esculenta]
MSGLSSRLLLHRVLYIPHRHLWIMEYSCKVWCKPCRHRLIPRQHSRLSWRLRLKYQLRTMVNLLPVGPFGTAASQPRGGGE